MSILRVVRRVRGVFPALLTGALLLAGLALCPPAFAQEELGGGALLASKRYGASSWPESGPARAGFAPATVDARGWTRRSLQLDAWRGEARLSFAAEDAGPEAEATAFVRVRLFPSAKQARGALLETLGAIQGRLTREPNLGDLAFASRSEAGLRYLVTTIGNQLLVLRGTADGQDLSPLAISFEGSARKTLPLEEGQTPQGPQLMGVEAQPVEGATLIRLSFEASPASVALRCEGGSIVATEKGYLLYTRREGALSLELAALTPTLGRLHSEIEVQVLPSEDE